MESTVFEKVGKKSFNEHVGLNFALVESQNGIHQEKERPSRGSEQVVNKTIESRRFQRRQSMDL